MSDLKPKQNESALNFIERADALGASDDAIDSILSEHFDLHEDAEVKVLKLKSEVFWRNLYLDHTKGIFERGGTRYAAIKFIQKKNGQSGQRKLTEEEIEKLVDSAGNWSR